MRQTCRNQAKEVDNNKGAAYGVGMYGAISEGGREDE